VLSTAGWGTPDALIDHLLAVFAAGASLVQVAHADPEVQTRRRTAEMVTKELWPAGRIDTGTYVL
jgi:hypothetical protein